MDVIDRAARPCILLVDDEPANLDILRELLSDTYQVLVARDGETAIALAERRQPNLILMDVMMPGIDGYTACARIKASPQTAAIPVIFVTARSDAMDETHGFEVGAVDYIGKPFSPAVVRSRVATHLSLVRVEELQATRLEIVQRLGRAAEYRDNETGLHVIRMSHYARLLALAAGWSPAAADEMLHAAPMHDIGKIGIPDQVLLKRAELDGKEWETMREHPWIGAQIIGEHDSSLLQMARQIAYTHHERWDGSGYPQGLRGEQIPECGRIVAVADVFDALSSHRPYKPAWPEDKVLGYLREQSGIKFEPRLVNLFLEQLDQVREIAERWREPPAA